MIMFVFAINICGCSNSINVNTDTTVDETMIVNTIETETAFPATTVPKITTLSPKEREENYKLFCEEYDYNDVLFAPDRYNGAYCKFTGKVLSLCKEDGSWFVLINDDGDMIDVHCAAEYFERNDEVEVYGTISDVKSTYYSNKAIIIVDAKYIDFI